jgi:hypothetical protein
MGLWTVPAGVLCKSLAHIDERRLAFPRVVSSWQNRVTGKTRNPSGFLHFGLEPMAVRHNSESRRSSRTHIDPNDKDKALKRLATQSTSPTTQR